MDPNTPQGYVDAADPTKQQALTKLRETINQSIPAGFEETIQYGMIGWVVPLSTYPEGYHCTPDTPLPFLSLAAQKHYIALYHSGLYGDDQLYAWFIKEYQNKGYRHKIDVGKSCIRFKYLEEIPYDLLAELMKKITPEQFIAAYEQGRKKGA